MFEKYEATKLTKGDKRGLPPGARSSKEFHADKRGAALPPVRPRTPAEIAAAQRALAAMALEQPDPEAWLRDTLEALGIMVNVEVAA